MLKYQHCWRLPAWQKLLMHVDMDRRLCHTGHEHWTKSPTKLGKLWRSPACTQGFVTDSCQLLTDQCDALIILRLKSVLCWRTCLSALNKLAWFESADLNRTSFNQSQVSRNGWSSNQQPGSRGVFLIYPIVPVDILFIVSWGPMSVAAGDGDPTPSGFYSAGCKPNFFSINCCR